MLCVTRLLTACTGDLLWQHFPRPPLRTDTPWLERTGRRGKERRGNDGTHGVVRVGYGANPRLHSAARSKFRTVHQVVLIRILILILIRMLILTPVPQPKSRLCVSPFLNQLKYWPMLVRMCRGSAWQVGTALRRSIIVTCGCGLFSERRDSDQNSTEMCARRCQNGGDGMERNGGVSSNDSKVGMSAWSIACL